MGDHLIVAQIRRQKWGKILFGSNLFQLKLLTEVNTVKSAQYLDWWSPGDSRSCRWFPFFLYFFSHPLLSPCFTAKGISWHAKFEISQLLTNLCLLLIEIYFTICSNYQSACPTDREDKNVLLYFFISLFAISSHILGPTQLKSENKGKRRERVWSQFLSTLLRVYLYNYSF